MTTSAARVPDFFIIGAPKCGTTSLYEWLRTHPNIYMPVKEPGYYSRDLVDVPFGKQDYLNFYRDCPSSEVLIGEATPKYLYSSNALREIVQDRPGARAIVLLRNPVDLVISFHSQMLTQAVETETDFQLAWNLVENRKQGLCVPPLCDSIAHLDYPMWGRIGSRLKDLYAVFQSEQILPLVLEDLAENPRQVYLRVLKFLGIPDDGRNEFVAQNARVEIKNQQLHHTLIALRTRLIPMLRPLFGRPRGGTGILKAVEYFNVRRAPSRESICREFRNRLVDFFAEEVALAEEILHRDLNTWKH